VVKGLAALPIKFYTDTHIAKAVAIQCQRRGIDVVRCEDVEMAQAKDEEHLAYAAREGRVMVSSDRDFTRLHDEYIKAGASHAGIIYVLPAHKDDIGRIVGFITDLCELIEGGAGTLEQDVDNQLVWL